MLNLRNLQGNNYIVVGLGLSGLSSCEALLNAGAQTVAWDDYEDNRRVAEAKGITIVDPLKISWENITALILSPGIPHEFPKPHPIAEYAISQNVPVICDIELLLQSQTGSTLIGITGTNGKSTTTALVGHLLKSLNRPVEIGGNIGIPVCNLPSLGTNGIYVLEFSSYHLERVPSLNLDIAVLTNITPDHLQRHGGMKGYIEAKKKIFNTTNNAQIALISIDDDYSKTMAQEIKSRHQQRVISISTQRWVDEGIYLQEGWLYDNAFESDKKMFNLKEIHSLRGQHNWQNILHAYAVARASSVSPDKIFEDLQTFKSLPHRLENIGHIGSIEFINDSKATNAESTYHALTACDDIYWILGGVAKETELQGLDPFFPKIHRAFTIGQATDRFATLLEGKIPVTRCYDLSHAVNTAFKDAQQLDKGTILLSPACASVDQFKNFEARGDAFRKMVEELKMQNLNFKDN